MAYLNLNELHQMGFAHVGDNVQISDKACIYNPEYIRIGDNSRIDDFCILSGRISIGRYCHITPMCLIGGGIPGVYIDDFCTLAYGCKLFSQSDDYSGATMVNSTIPRKYKAEIFESVHLAQHVILGTNTVVLPGVHIAEGCSVGAMSLMTCSTEPWGIYYGVPARRRSERKRDILILVDEFINQSHFN